MKFHLVNDGTVMDLTTGERWQEDVNLTVYAEAAGVEVCDYPTFEMAKRAALRIERTPDNYGIAARVEVMES